MSRILNLGSINIDHVYSVDHFVRPGETLASLQYSVFAGGKGFNQSVALARAGAAVAHLGAVGADGLWLTQRLASEGVDLSSVAQVGAATGHAMIQVSASGENAIVLHAGANHALSAQAIERAMDGFGPDDWLLTQNETNGIAEAMKLAKARGMKIAFNPAPMTDAVQGFPLEMVDLFIVNETEAEALAGASIEMAGEALCACYPQAAVLLTLGAEGAVYFKDSERHFQSAERVEAIDTTAAGDTFIGYFLASLLARDDGVEESLALACRAAGIAVTRLGASDSIPRRDEL
ncbi:ribokinase [Cerasicoccus maritimus]|uniref:ribokinase n=1 Tax=Cerasicoccus maritimus TaxID=490089 RepID=UPI002852D026|nr:ribokinase [Cerasicoccus maritimus]